MERHEFGKRCQFGGDGFDLGEASVNGDTEAVGCAEAYLRTVDGNGHTGPRRCQAAQIDLATYVRVKWATTAATTVRAVRTAGVNSRRGATKKRG